MAIDTATKRASCVNIGMPWVPILPPPDGDIAAADRATLSSVYAGFESESGGGGGGGVGGRHRYQLGSYWGSPYPADTPGTY